MRGGGELAVDAGGRSLVRLGPGPGSWLAAPPACGGSLLAARAGSALGVGSGARVGGVADGVGASALCTGRAFKISSMPWMPTGIRHCFVLELAGILLCT